MYISNLTVYYKEKRVLDRIHMAIQTGCITGIVGPNGAGKSTLLKAMLGLIKCESGEATLFDVPLHQIKQKIAYVPQRSEIDLTFPINVLEMVLLGTYPSLALTRKPKRREKEKALHALRQVDMESYQKKQIGELSGGQLQRIFMARALAQDAEIFLLDEPFVGIDATSEALIISLLKKLRDDGKTLLVVHHDFQKVADYFDEIILLNKQLITIGPVEEHFTDEMIKKAYTIKA
ncbi:metal ABC transporter ATP-binding protein [Listeria fleischmannii]|jgi:ABC-type Mn2+/Zn2+ transport system ATPase subunit|uniref:Metal ABC transporter ATP-binding protein n=2 Tax=Listeria fleischmannii TaxID=1069827 RepID=A0A841YHG5_9LIST|nr:metal ABC transporter ATP-binding protein [Listeria fleischmannii]EIA21301.1 manganese/iron transporter ATP-binding protein [Listeria fleischmannii subsp. coloradonensis]MBC1399574.1 metal ABC transporter ATP-binding protein [Listeria fleischmannii]MBC1427913.1 metal ABC transporter ATP-binding protein [Listeria fleischmannii]STY35457.1 Hemin import ATP-binding protein HmuV [Listeria fleischmannii subsp. coloradonensis]